MEIQKASDNRVAKVNPYNQHSQKLIQCLIKMDLPEAKSEAKMEFVSLVSDLMPAGIPAFLSMIKFPMIRDLVNEHGKKIMLKVIFLLIRDFCSSINVVRNMNQDQMIEAAAMLLDECGNFRLQDYTMMFSMAKRGQLVKILDRIDISVIIQLMDEYWKLRNGDAEKLKERECLERLGPSARLIDTVHPLDAKLYKSVDNLAIAFADLKSKLMEWNKKAIQDVMNPNQK